MISIIDAIVNNAKNNANKIIFIDKDKKITNEELLRNASQIASGLLEYNNQPIAIYMNKGVDLITSITFGTDGKKYESNSKSHHDHLICTTCGKIVEFMDDDIEKRQDKIAKKNNFKISSHSMQLYGICENCQK